MRWVRPSKFPQPGEVLGLVNSSIGVSLTVQSDLMYLQFVFWIYFCFLLEERVSLCSQLALNSWSSYLSLPSAGVTGVATPWCSDLSELENRGSPTRETGPPLRLRPCCLLL
jgi:hypothetical protein